MHVSISFWPVHDTKVTPAPKDVKGSEMQGRVERGSGLTAARTPWWSRVSLGVVLTAESASSVPGWGTKVPQATRHGQKTNKQTNKPMCNVLCKCYKMFEPSFKAPLM